MKPGQCHLASGVEASEIGPAGKIGPGTPTLVVGGGNDGNRLSGQVHVQVHAVLVNIGEAPARLFGILCRCIEVHTIATARRQLCHYRPRHHVPCGQ